MDDYTIDALGRLLVTTSSTFIGDTDTPVAYGGNANKVLFVNAVPDAVAFASNLYWDEINDRLGINDNAPARRLDVNSGGIDIVAAFTSSDANARIGLVDNTTTADTWVGIGALGDALELYAGANVRVTILTGGNVGIAAVMPARQLHVLDSSASTNTIIPIARIEARVSGGAGAAGHGPSYEFYGETTTTENQSMAQIAARWSVPTHASRRARVEIYAAYIGTDVLVGVIEAPAVASVDGNARGVGAVDFQGYRGAVAANVASGDYAVISGGRSSEVPGDYSVVAGGREHVVSGDHSLAFGRANTVSADYASASGYYTIADRFGQVASASGRLAASGDAQGTIQMVARITRPFHGANVWYSLFLNGIAEQMTIAADTAWAFHILVIGVTQNAAQQFGYEITGVIERDNANNTTVPNFTVTTLFESDANYDAQVVADDANEALEVQVRRTGGVDYDINWVATIRTVEVSYA